jgi:hypothetical protein
MLVVAEEGKRMPVKGKQAKIKPVPMREMKAECFEPVGHALPCLKLRIIDVKKAKMPAKT